MKLGFCGVGKWASKLAAAFRACGAEIVCHDRKTVAQGERFPLPAIAPAVFGNYIPWRQQLDSPSIDAIIAVAPPEVTTEVALACAAAGKPVMATKPLFDHPETIRAPFYVDFWRLWSEAQAKLHDGGVAQIMFKSPGPVRSFPGSFDYGPHVMAAMMDTGLIFLEGSGATPTPSGELFWARYTGTKTSFWTEFGNGATVPKRSWGAYEETATHIGDEPKADILQLFCQSFLNDVSEGFVDTRLLNLSRDGMRELRRIREMATASNPKPRSEP